MVNCRKVGLSMLLPKTEIGATKNGLQYVCLGQKYKRLVVFPGVRDAFHPVTAAPRLNAWFFRHYAEHFSTYCISRRRGLPQKYSTRDMVRDYAEAIEEIGKPVHVVGFSMGCIIAQHLAVDFPELVDKLVLALAGWRPTPEAIEHIRRWERMAREGQWKELHVDMVETTSSGLWRTVWRWLTPLVGKPPEIPSDVIVAFQACLRHNVPRLGVVKAPTLVIGGTADALAPVRVYRELSAAIPNAKLVLIEGGSHGLPYEKQKAFDEAVLAFLQAP